MMIEKVMIELGGAFESLPKIRKVRGGGGGLGGGQLSW